MKKYRLFILIGVTEMIFGAYLAVRANKRYADFDIRFKTFFGLSGSETANSQFFTTVQSGSLRTAMLKTNVGNTKLATMVTAINNSHRVYYK
ncbi:hypothetical protein Q4E93_24975 [Flavitalea sp. BT771]|uniref:hypothetical protein n=1 Tax=Flavitalea sp. BT771 TaxID=3063329 RepID=UPI0026E14B2B|nr:hypothetical protein [Flavitalea sp. BT771]MDO6433884.1 hypothetical protein [Flavitalea sp. BT771]MDV6222211.1 hypothetical protein [Flavitalea sp. BT771]